VLLGRVPLLVVPVVLAVSPVLARTFDGCTCSCGVAPSLYSGLLEARLAVVEQMADMFLESRQSMAVAAGARPNTLAPGTVVRRGPDWRYADQDGSSSAMGVVVRMAYFQAEAQKGIVVRWPHSTANYTYRWGADGGKYDVEVISGSAGKEDAKYKYVMFVRADGVPLPVAALSLDPVCVHRLQRPGAAVEVRRCSVSQAKGDVWRPAAAGVLPRGAGPNGASHHRGL
jgi:hypothetical protein